MLKQWKKREEISCFSDHNSEDSNDFMIQYNPNQSETYKDAIISKALTQEQNESLTEMMEEFQEIFSDVPGTTHLVEFDINTGESKPISTKPYPIPHKYRVETMEEIEQLLKEGIIIESDSEWCSPVVVRPKIRDGVHKGIRMCIDFREINKVTINNPFPLPRTEDLLEKLSTSKYITTLDLTKGYYQIKCSESTQNRTAFVVGNNKYEFTRMPFGTKNASGIFQRLIQKILHECNNYAENFIDDVVIHSNSWSDHLCHLKSVFIKIKEAGLTAKPSKCNIGHAEVQFMGHFVGKGFVHPLQSKIETIRNYPIPKTKKQVRQAIGLFSYYRKFIPNFAEIAYPITDLTKKGRTNVVAWTTECDIAFKRLKEAMCNEPVLRLPDHNKCFYIQVDACDHGLGAILSQYDSEGNEHPICYASRKLLPRERHYATTETKYFRCPYYSYKAVTKMFKCYIYGKPFVLIVDHNPLVWLNRVKDTNEKLYRWSLQLQEYDYEICHKAGKDHINADVLSRIE